MSTLILLVHRFNLWQCLFDNKGMFVFRRSPNEMYLFRLLSALRRLEIRVTILEDFYENPNIKLQSD